VIFAAIVALTMPLLVIGGGLGQAKPFGMNGRIAFVRVVNAAAGEEKQRATYLVDPDGTNPQLLPVGTSPDPAPLWSPDGSKILVGIGSGCASGGACGQIMVDVPTGSFYELPVLDAFDTCPPMGDCGNTFFGVTRGPRTARASPAPGAARSLRASPASTRSVLPTAGT
jgi:hypothetical protein